MVGITLISNLAFYVVDPLLEGQKISIVLKNVILTVVHGIFLGLGFYLGFIWHFSSARYRTYKGDDEVMLNTNL